MKEIDCSYQRAERIILTAIANDWLLIDPAMDDSPSHLSLSDKKRSADDVDNDLLWVVSTIEQNLMEINEHFTKKAITKLGKDAGRNPEQLEHAMKKMAREENVHFANFKTESGVRYFLGKIYDALFEMTAVDMTLDKVEFCASMSPLVMWFYRFDEENLQRLEYIVDESCLRPLARVKKNITEKHYNIVPYSTQWFEIAGHVDRQLKNKAVSALSIEAKAG